MSLRYAFVALIVALPASAWAQAPGSWLVDQSTKCKLWWPDDPYAYLAPGGTYTYSSVHWKGACQNGVAKGHGSFEFAGVRRYPDKPSEAASFTQAGEGDFTDGKMTGKGFANQQASGIVERSEGEFRDGLLNGKGFKTGQTDTSFSRYEGGFRDGKEDGWGVATLETWQSTTRDHAYFHRYEGEYRNGKRNGKGIQVDGRKGCSRQQRYEGEYKNGAMDGRGTLRTIDGKTYTGVFKEGGFGNLDSLDLFASSDDIDKVCH